MGHRDLADALAVAARAMQDSRGETDTLEVAVRLAVDVVHGCTSAGLFELDRNGRVRTTAATDPLVERGDQLQLQLGEGPCLTALVGEPVVLSRDLSSESRWASWSKAASDELGIRSMLSLQLYTGPRGHGSLNLYSTEQDAFDDRDQAVAVTLAAQIAAAIAAARRDDQLTASAASRTVIGQAQGILMERYHLDASQAFAALIRTSQSSNTKLYAVAETLVRTRQTPAALTEDDPAR
ncbi:GAF and ANTAR domain-containing protein [Auraticoccus monumenti]|uniref:GAF domain-containing protein n=1 Tax=Auraticoccus monumenti TaxID=675864 RepID=A0A1G6VYD6_9ACTN|nr:GAF and ANTAR domain-containing protein [Auraticoccus monumenti]SDD57816.1 GAF domain-containing protein [Auraticoccus monumenti]